MLKSTRKLKEELEVFQSVYKNWDTSAYRVAEKRVKNMSTHDMISWADEAGTQMCRVLFDYSNERDHEVRLVLLKELSIAISSFQALTERLIATERLLQ